jgi:glycosyltransferase involved in cell wall biosynthesis
LKILILTPDIYTRGGIARYTWTLASALGDLIGPENVHVLAFLNTENSQEGPKAFRVLGAIADRPTATAKMKFAAKAVAKARKKYDLVICAHVALAPIAAAIRLLYGTPFWVACHGIEVWGRLPLVERLALQRADRVAPISRFTAQMVTRVNGVSPKMISILHNAISDEFARLLARLEEPSPTASCGGHQKTIFSVGMLSKALSYKGFDTMIRVLPRVLEAVPDVRYVIAGDGDNRQDLQKLAFEFGVGNHVEFKGEVPNDELAALYHACDVFVLPSRTREEKGSWQGEGFGRVYVEAALAGKPVVGSRDGGAAEAVLDGQTGILVDPASEAEVVAALISLLGNPGLAARMGREGRRWAQENFTQTALRRQLGQMLTNLPGAPRESASLCAESSE